MARWTAGRMIWWWRVEAESGSGSAKEETRDERAAERVSEARVAWRVCSAMNEGIFSRPRSVSERQLRSVFSSALSSVVWASFR